MSKTQGRHGARHRCRRELVVVEQVQLAGPDVLGTEQLRRLPVVAREFRDQPKIRGSRLGRQVPDPQAEAAFLLDGRVAVGRGGDGAAVGQVLGVEADDHDRVALESLRPVQRRQGHAHVVVVAAPLDATARYPVLCVVADADRGVGAIRAWRLSVAAPETWARWATAQEALAQRTGLCVGGIRGDGSAGTAGRAGRVDPT